MQEINKAKFEKDGAVLIENVLNQDEIEVLRKVAYETIKKDEEKDSFFLHRHAKNHLGCLTDIPEFKKLILDDRVIKIAETLLGGTPVFFGDSIMEIGIGNRGFHKDTANRTDPNHPDWTEDYPIIRIAFYLEDHSKHSGGLKVRLGSHSTPKTNVGKAVILPTKAGDAAAFSLRTSHAGNAVRLKIAPELSLDNRIEKRVPSFLKLPEEKERVSIFLTYGLKSGALDRFLEFMFNHRIYKQRIDSSNYPQELQNEINSKIEFLDIKEAYSNYLIKQQ